jgi:hypothetical protein
MSEQLPLLKVFVVGPIGDRDDPHGSPRRVIFEEAIQVLEQVIEPACIALGLDVIRADQISRTGEIPEQIFRQLRDAHIVIADLTGANPNVMYELGLRHTTGKLTIQIGERERLPFDISAIRTILFKRTDGGLVEARRLLVQALATGLQSGGDPVAATRVWFEEGLVEIDKVDEPEEASPEGMEELGFLEKLADTEEGIAALGQTLTTATSIIGEISGIFSDGAAKANGLAQSGGPASAKLALANRIAALLENPANRLRIAATEYSTSIDRIEPGLLYIFGRLASEPEQFAEAGEFPEAIAGLVVAAASSIDGTLGFKAIVEEIGNSTRSMRQVNRRIAAASQSFAESSKRVALWKTLLDQLPPKETGI